MPDSRADFADGKDAGALRSIGEVSAALGIKPHVLRYWEDQFPSLKPLKRAGGRRLYRPEDVALIQRIESLVTREGYTLKGAKAAIGGEKASAEPVSVAQQREAPLPSDLIARLKTIRAELAAALAA